MLHRSFKNTAQDGFTLLEMILVIVILAVLAILLSSTLGNMRVTANKVRCISNLRELGRVALLYAAEHRNSLVPLRRDPVGDPAGLWYDHLHQYVGRRPGREGRNVGGVKVNYPGFNCLLLEKRYIINRLCGFTRTETEEPRNYLKLGQGFAKGKVIELPGGLSKTAWFTCPKDEEGGEAFLPENYAKPGNGFIGFPHSGTTNVLFMDGHVENLHDPGFQENPSLLEQQQWVQFFGTKP